jgi:hypothetical protein
MQKKIFYKAKRENKFIPLLNSFMATCNVFFLILLKDIRTILILPKYKVNHISKLNKYVIKKPLLEDSLYTKLKVTSKCTFLGRN